MNKRYLFFTPRPPPLTRSRSTPTDRCNNIIYELYNMAKRVCVCVYRSNRDFPAKKPHHIILTSPGRRHPHTTCTRDLIHQDSRQNTPAAAGSLSVYYRYLPTYTFIITCFFIFNIICVFFFLAACARKRLSFLDVLVVYLYMYIIII